MKIRFAVYLAAIFLVMLFAEIHAEDGENSPNPNMDNACEFPDINKCSPEEISDIAKSFAKAAERTRCR